MADGAEAGAQAQSRDTPVELDAAAVLEAFEELEEALGQVKQLQGLLPICSYCKKIRDDENYWHQVDFYIRERTNARFSHGICPDCYNRVMKEEMEPFLRAKGEAAPNPEA